MSNSSSSIPSHHSLQQSGLIMIIIYIQSTSHWTVCEKYVVGYVETVFSADLDDRARCNMLGACDPQSVAALVLVTLTNTRSKKHATWCCAQHYIDYMCYMPTTDYSFSILLLCLCIKMSIWPMKSLIPVLIHSDLSQDTSLHTEVCGNGCSFLFPRSDSHSHCHSQCYSFSFLQNFRMNENCRLIRNSNDCLDNRQLHITQHRLKSTV